MKGVFILGGGGPSDVAIPLGDVSGGTWCQELWIDRRNGTEGEHRKRSNVNN